MQRLKRVEDKKKQEALAQTSHPHLLGTGMQAGGSPILSTRLKDGMTTETTWGDPYFGGSISICGRVSTCREFRIFTVNKSVTADGSLLSPTGGVNGIHPALDIHLHAQLQQS